ncbi:MAG TPA: hypothetical protein VEK07_09790 [Polyangiaceae bacterium]|nr:hypothetical protein [Polyangiaceae bacterium]
MLRVVKLRRRLAVSATLLPLTAALARTAFAFGGTAPNLERQGNFAVTNDAGLAFDQQIGHGGGTTFSLRPALDYFVIDRLSIGGAIEFDYASGKPSFTQFRIAPEIGYELALSDTWSFWPQASLPISVPNPGPTSVAIAIFAPFLVHPAEHFFFGAGPGFSQALTSPATTQITAAFLIGGYFDH